MDPAVLSHVADGVATLTLRNPAKRNALTPAMWRALAGLVRELADDPAVRVLVLTGHGGTFSAGADIAALRSGTAPRELASAAEEALAAFPGPTLAVIRGHCVGGGCQLAVACDLRFASEDALLGVTPARLGLVYPPGATARLARLVGPATAKYLLFSAELMGARRALACGLLNEVLAATELADRVAAFTATLAARSLLTQRAAKEFVDHGPDGAHLERWARPGNAERELAEGVAAFTERREPRFTWPG
ncbi:enoyl-CoA hydratase/isomerase family protein [Streptomyces spiramenti]|uniref:Enoyl-CoA hydratase/isomerase family protein n=1 Tax=Streptomyces spiramenti TaxID=2720606 RepID=A0ABX1AF60_9ACTN|nr:enoyl-CoA hydratase/isomerase family protein [Streptomyces spiramenti]NJP65783.1 enoyl-CoA hydratase/isomerase family protein [Streptomyces spiramenti]